MFPRFKSRTIAVKQAISLSSAPFNTSEYMFHNQNSDNFVLKAFDIENLVSISSSMRQYLEINHGFPSQRNGVLADIDSGLSILMHEKLVSNNIMPTPSEASDILMWSFFNICIIPDIIIWRFINSEKIVNKDRFCSKRRNYGGYLWWSAFIFKDDDKLEPWGILKSLSIDSIVQMIERPGVGYNKDFLRELARKIVNSTEEDKTKLLRGAMKRAKFTFAVVNQSSDERINKHLIHQLISWSSKYYIK